MKKYNWISELNNIYEASEKEIHFKIESKEFEAGSPLLRSLLG